MVKNNIKIYNGIRYLNLAINETHIGYKVGNFTITKKRCIFKKAKKKELKFYLMGLNFV